MTLHTGCQTHRRVNMTRRCALQALEAAALKPGQRVLIHAGAGGLGSWAIQLVRSLP